MIGGIKVINEKENTIILMYKGADLSNAKVTDAVNEISMNENSEITFSVLFVINYVNCRIQSEQCFQLFMNKVDRKTGKVVTRTIVDFRMPQLDGAERVSQVKTINMSGITLDVPGEGEYSLELFMCDSRDIPDGASDDYDIREVGKIVASYFFGVVS